MDPVEEIKSRLSIEDVVGRFVDLKRSGASLKGLCPFHSEKTPSFYVRPSHGTFHCFGCGRGGDSFNFVMEMEKLTFPEALAQLAQQAGVQLPERKTSAPSLAGRLYEANEAAAAFYHAALKAPQGERARNYLRGRGFDDAAIDLFGLGYAEGRTALSQHLRERGFDDRIPIAADLVRQDDGGGTRDSFRGRLMFPIRDASGKVCGLGGRALADVQPKYLNTSQTEVFDKSSVLFGIHLAAGAMRTSGRAVVVEGYLDAVRAHVAGFADTVASMGTAINEHHLALLARFTGTVILALDPDVAGQKAAARTALDALAAVTARRGRAEGASAALEVRVARLPVDSGDPDELIRDHPERWKAVLDASVPAFDFFFRTTIDSLDRTSDAWKQQAIDQLLPVIRQFSTSTVWQATWMERLAVETGVDPQVLLRSIPTAGARPARRPGASQKAPQDVVAGTTSRALSVDPVVGMEQALLALLLTVLVLPDESAAQVQNATWQRAEHRELSDALLAWRVTGNYEFELFRERLPERLRPYADELHSRNEPLPEEAGIDLAVRQRYARIEQLRLTAELKRASQALNDADGEARGPAMQEVARLNTSLRAILGQLDELSRKVMQGGGAA